MFAKSDEIPSMNVQDIKEKPKRHRQRITKGNELGQSPYFSIISVHLVDINAFAKFEEIPSLLAFQDINEKSKRRRQKEGGMDKVKTVYPPPKNLWGGGV